MDDLKKIIISELKEIRHDANSLIDTIQREYPDFDYTKDEIYKVLDQMESDGVIEVNTSDWKLYIL